MRVPAVSRPRESDLKSIELDYSKRCGEEPTKGHNRWHPDIPPAVEAEPGEEVVMQTRHAFDGGVTPSSTAADLNNVGPERGPSSYRPSLRPGGRARRPAGMQHPAH